MNRDQLIIGRQGCPNWLNCVSHHLPTHIRRRVGSTSQLETVLDERAWGLGSGSVLIMHCCWEASLLPSGAVPAVEAGCFAKDWPNKPIVLSIAWRIRLTG